MRFVLSVMLFSLLVGCSSQTAPTVDVPAALESGSTPKETTAADAGSDTKVAGGTSIALTPENARIQFVGTHVGPKPDPKARVGTFSDFKGTAVTADDELASVMVEIQMTSVSTPHDKLNMHLQAPDFFDVRAYPTAKFESTSVSKTEDGNHLIAGNLTLHGETKEIELVGTVEVADGGVDIEATVELDRSEFGMDQNLDKVNKEVPLTIAVGKFATMESSP